MNRRILKKRAKRFMDSFTREKIPAAFTSEEERRQYVSAFARQYVGQAAEPLPGKARPPGVPLGRRGTPAKAGVRRSRWSLF